MDQVDKIIIDTLNTLGCDLESSVSSLSQFRLEEVVVGVVHCLRVSSPDRCAGLSHKLPQNMAQRFRAAAAIAQEVKLLGYSGDLGYQSLLYPNEVDIRRLFSFLLEKLPRDAGDLHQEPLSGAGVLLAAARKQLRSQLSRPWLPPHCRSALLKRRKLAQQQQQQPSASPEASVAKALPIQELAPLGETRHLRPFESLHLLRVGREVEEQSCSGGKDKERQSAAVGDLGVCVKKITTGRALLCSLLAAHARQLQVAQLLPSVGSSASQATSSATDTRGLDPLHTDQFLSVPSPSTDSLVTPLSPLSPMLNLSLSETNRAADGADDPVSGSSSRKQEQENDEQLQASLMKLGQQKNEQLQLLGERKEAVAKLSEELACLQQSDDELQEDLVSLQRTLELLPSSQENRARLEAVIASSDAKMVRLKEQFTAHCAPIQDSIDAGTKQIQQQQGEQERLSGEIQSLRQRRQAVQQEAPTVQAQTQLLTEKLQARGQAVGRSVYTKRILEITGAVHQQRKATETVLLDIRKLQKEINSLAGKIDRSFTVIEEVSYKASWSNSTCLGLYRRVISLHDDSSAIVDIIRETGAINRQVAELKEQVMLEERRETTKALTKLQEDLAAVKQENATIKAERQ